ncbi:MAG: S8 family serine peptidase [Bacteroidota bacterium]
MSTVTFRLLLIFLGLFCTSVSFAQLSSNKLMVTVRHGSSEDEITRYFNENGLIVSRPFQRFEQTDPDTDDIPFETKSGVYLGDYWRVELPKAANTEAWITKLKRQPWVKNAEPELGYSLLTNIYTPNDSNLGNQWYLNTASFPEAWTISKGDSSLVVGIVDTGIEKVHPDLSENIWVNMGETGGVAGVDDDQNGYIDDATGFNFAQPSGNHDGQGHGTFVAGITGAVTDNGTGIAGGGFDCQMMSLRVYNSTNGQLSGTLEAVLYAAENGAKIINLSLGRSGFPADWEEDIYNYVVLDKDALVIAAAGNAAQNAAAPEEDYYPASYHNVLSVGAINPSRQRSGNYVVSSKMDIVAPGFGIYSTFPSWRGTGGYATGSGTSFASPLAAGAGVLVRSTFPQLSARQARELIRVTTEDHYSFGANATYEGYFGNGILNAHRALTYQDSAISVRLEDFELLDATAVNDSVYEFTVTADFINFLNPVSGLSVTASPELSSVTMLDSLITTSQLLEGEAWEDQIFRFRMHRDELGQNIRFRLNYAGANGLYTDYEYFDVPVDQNYLRARMNQFDFALTNVGRVGYLDANHFEGYGMHFGGKHIAREAGLFVAASPTQVSDGLLEDYINSPASRAICLPPKCIP